MLRAASPRSRVDCNLLLHEEGSMETSEVHRGRLIDHIQLVVADLAASQTFYTAVLAALQ
jgi:catechol-2,3-dioxygenase